MNNMTSMQPSKLACKLHDKYFGINAENLKLMPSSSRLLIEGCEHWGWSERLTRLLADAIEVGLREGTELGREQLLAEQAEEYSYAVEQVIEPQSPVNTQAELSSNDIVCAFVEIKNYIERYHLQESFTIYLDSNQVQVTGLTVRLHDSRQKDELRQLDIPATLERLRAFVWNAGTDEMTGCFVKKAG